jgi:hypothetical protein
LGEQWNRRQKASEGKKEEKEEQEEQEMTQAASRLPADCFNNRFV